MMPSERLDRLPWSRWHWRVVTALGVTWILDGLEVTIVGSLGGVLQEKETLHLSVEQVGLSATAYLAGAVLGSLVFGWLTDRLGRKRLFLVTLAVYLVATTLTAFSWGFASFAIFRFLTGAGIGGEYSAINSAIDELLPARVRGRADIAINGTFWLGTALGAATSFAVLDPRLFGHAIGWRVAFGLGAVLGLGILLLRSNLPESPRWLVAHGRAGEAEAVLRAIEADVGKTHALPPLPDPGEAVDGPSHHGSMGPRLVARILFRKYPSRTVLGISLMVAQAFFYNAIFFTYALVLTKFYGIETGRVALYIFPFAAGNLAGPLLLGKLFDTIGRRRMIAATYAVSGILLVATGYAFEQGWLTATTHTLLWSMTFFVASTAASSAYLTVSEVFPLEMRGLAIALFYSVGTGVGGVVAPVVLSALIATGRRAAVFLGYALAGSLMVIAAGVAIVLGVDAEGRSLEKIASAREDPSES
jgi:MFS family permease